MITEDDVQELDGSDAVDRDGRLVGEVDQVYLDDSTGTPTWVAVLTGHSSGTQFLPLHEAWMEAGEVTFPYTREEIARAPKLAPGDHLDVEQERRLYDHYGVEYDDPSPGPDQSREAKRAKDQTDPTGEKNAPTAGGVRAHLPGGRTDSAQEATSESSDVAAAPGATDRDEEPDVEPVTLMEERLVVGTRVRVSGTTRIATRVVTEERTITVTVRREELVIEHEPATERGAGLTRDDGARESLEAHPLAGTPREIVLHEEVPVVTMQTRPVETARIGVETVTVQQQVSDNVRREYLEGHPPA